MKHYTQSVKDIINKAEKFEDPFCIFDYISNEYLSLSEIRDVLDYLNEKEEDLDLLEEERSNYYFKLFELNCKFNYKGAKDLIYNYMYRFNFSNFLRHKKDIINLSKETKANYFNLKDYDQDKIYPEDLFHEEIIIKKIKDVKIVYDLFIKKTLNRGYSIDEEATELFTSLTYEELSKIYKPKAFLNTESCEKYFYLLRQKSSDDFIKGAKDYIKNILTGDRVLFLDYIFNRAFDYRIKNEEERNKLIKDISKNDLLTYLTRGELQQFLVTSNMPINYRIALLDSLNIDVFKDGKTLIDIQKQNKNLADIYEKYYYFMHCNLDEQIDKREDYIIDCLLDKDSYKKKYIKQLNYEMKNLKKNLCEKDLAKRFKMLNECCLSFTYNKSYGINEEDESKEKFYFMMLEETIKEFYSQIGIDYDKCDINNNLPREIYYGIEAEQYGVRGIDVYCNKYFSSTFDSSIKPYNKSKGCYYAAGGDNKYTGEFISNVLSSDSLIELEGVNYQMYRLSLLGGRPNNTCGFHIHVSSDYTDNADAYGYKQIFECYDKYAKENYSESYEEDKKYYNLVKDKEGFDIPNKISKEIFDMQEIIANKFKVFYSRYQNGGFAQYLKSPIPENDERYRFVNLQSLQDGKGVEFRFFNLPDYLDKKVIETYIDFTTTYYAYMEEGNNTLEYVKETLEELNSDKKYTKQELDDLKFEILLDELDLKEDSIKVIKNLDKIFEFYGVKEDTSYYMDRDEINYYEKIDKTIHSEEVADDEIIQE